MQSKRRIRDFGLEKAIKGGSSSPHPHARSVIGGYERYLAITNKKDISDWIEGNINFGFIEDGSAPKGTIAKLRLKDLNRHCLIIGPTGVGKSNLARIIADGLMEQNVPLWIFDRTGDHIHAYRKQRPLIFPIQNLRLNPNEEPSGVPFDDWLEYFTPALSHALVLTDVTRASLMNLIRYSVIKFGEKNKELRPSIYEQRLYINDLKPSSYRDSARMAYWSRLEDRFDNMLNSTLRYIFACYKGHDLIKLLNENIVFDCRGVSNQVLRILLPLIIMKIYCYRLYNK